MALSANKDRPSKAVGAIQDFLVEDDKHIFKSSLCVLNAAGYLEVATNAANKVLAGVAYEECDNTLAGHSQGGKSVRVVRGGSFLFTTADLVQADVGILCYITDDNTVDDAGTATQGIIAGIVAEIVSATEVWIDIAHGVTQGALSANANADA